MAPTPLPKAAGAAAALTVTTVEDYPRGSRTSGKTTTTTTKNPKHVSVEVHLGR